MIGDPDVGHIFVDPSGCCSNQRCAPGVGLSLLGDGEIRKDKTATQYERFSTTTRPSLALSSILLPPEH